MSHLVFEELKAALNSATPSQLSSHSTLKAAENLLACLRRDGVGAGSSPSPHYGMNYVDGATKPEATSQPSASKQRPSETTMKGSSWSASY
mmetsp:Transcript_73517/g.195699  ORF Transcript_73517/g.195699 Transcript_73517/m.195699 type:complete len:91 (-) Transcript_73517:24-296(-)|eukprot:CAMPEP_0113670364 /NCGR_PEP_ID=MMETSP0038_2-20120614/5097_1 /TAXON_ID=2898 /ORGANISM="Cryptomonas paramecium" /LENGTH=90 /DNA_ID=CAMNT_0000586375 /DNA_START=6 /DNA_END=278 /DNA_ORIENTATION=+ /assembly_acc=CAM_ASM_000170